MVINNDGSVSSGFENLSEGNYKNIFSIIRNFLNSYASKSDDISDKTWLDNILAEHLPDKSTEEISSMSQDILTHVSKFDETKQEAYQARVDGLKPHEWTANKIQEAAVGMSAQEYGEKIGNLYSVYKHGNEEMMKTILRKDGNINMNPNLDGFIAEGLHTNSFNQNAAKNNSTYEARVFGRNTKNSVDIGMYDKSANKLVQRYQLKYYSTAEETIKAIERGEYRGQQIVVPSEQLQKVQEHFPNRKISDRITAPDGTQSDPLTKENVKKLQQDFQCGKEFGNNFDMALDLGKQVAFAGVAGAAIGAGAHVMGKILSDEKVEADEVIGAALKSCADSGIKAAVGGALNIAVEKNLLPAAVGTGFSKIAGPVIEGVKIFGDLITGEIDGEEAVSRFMWLGASTFITDVALGGISVTSTLAAALPIICSPVGVAVGFAVGAIAFGSEICDAVGFAFDTIGNIASDIWSGLETMIDGIGSAVGGIIDWLLD